MPTTPHLYPSGDVHFTDDRLSAGVRFAHITDLHLQPVNEKDRPAEYRHGIEWWEKDFAYPLKILPGLLDEVRDLIYHDIYEKQLRRAMSAVGCWLS